MIRFLLVSALSFGFTSTVLAQTSNCEAMTIETVLENGEATEKKAATFHAADTFIESVYNDESNVVDTIGGEKIRAIMCERTDVIPTLRDFPIIKTGIPLSLSDNFDSPESALLTVYFTDGQFKHKYIGTPMGTYAQDALDDVMEVFNLQPHTLE